MCWRPASGADPGQRRGRAPAEADRPVHGPAVRDGPEWPTGCTGRPRGRCLGAVRGGPRLQGVRAGHARYAEGAPRTTCIGEPVPAGHRRPGRVLPGGWGGRRHPELPQGAADRTRCPGRDRAHGCHLGRRRDVLRGPHRCRGVHRSRHPHRHRDRGHGLHGRHPGHRTGCRVRDARPVERHRAGSAERGHADHRALACLCRSCPCGSIATSARAPAVTRARKYGSAHGARCVQLARCAQMARRAQSSRCAQSSRRAQSSGFTECDRGRRSVSMAQLARNVTRSWND